MKTRRFLIPFLLILFTLVGAGRSHAQDSTGIGALLESRHWTFRAQMAHPMSGQARQLTSNYDLSLRGDSLISFLPYFGRSYVPVIGGEGGIKLNTTEFSHKWKKRKKGGYEVSIRPKSNREVREFFLTVSENGYGTLQVMSNNRQPISFSGYLMK